MSVRVVRFGSLKIGDDHPVRVMGVINLSSESFYSGSIVTRMDDISKKIIEMEQEGADIIDVGAASTAPSNYYGNRGASAEKEQERVRKYMRAICNATDLPISIDTQIPEIAEVALDYGAAAVNDISGLQDERMIALVAERRVPIIIMGNCNGPCDSVQSTIQSIRQSILRAKAGGIEEEQMIIDPGIGFGKPPDVDFALIRRLDEFRQFDQPILVGVSRKAFIGALLNQPDPADRLEGTIAVTSIAVANGAHIIRAHDVRETLIATKIGEMFRKGAD